MTRAGRLDVLGFVVAVLACLAGPLTAHAQFEGQYLGNVTITNGTTPSPPAGATAEIVRRSGGTENYLVTLRDGTFNPSMFAFYDGVFLRGGDVLANGVHRTLSGGYLADGNTLSLEICLGPDSSLHRCDFRVFAFQGVLAPTGACVLLADGSCMQTQAFLCALLGGQYVGDAVGCQEAGACTLNGICSIKTAQGCDTIGGTFNGVGTRCPLPGETINWINTQGGDYAVAGNWDPAQVPVHNAQRSDAAVFTSVSTVLTIPIAASQATAGRWEILDSAVAFSGDATLSSPATSPPSLALGFGSLLEYQSGFFTTRHATIGSGTPQSRVTLGTGVTWFNLGNLRLGTNRGAGGVEVGEMAFLSVNGSTQVGSGSDAELIIQLGGVAQLQNGLLVGSISGGGGIVTVSETGPGRRSRLAVTGYTGVGNPLAPSGSPGFLTVTGGAEMELNGGLGVSQMVVGAGSAAVSIEGILPTATATVHGTILIGELGPGDMIIRGGSTVDCNALTLGSLIGGANGELQLVGLGSGILVDQNVQIGGSGGHGLVNLGTGTFLDVTGAVTVGHLGGGEFIVNSQASATIGNGLSIGSLAGGAGAVVVSGAQSELDVTGLTVVGVGPANSTGSLTVRNDAKVELHGNLNVSHLKPDPNDAAVFLASSAVLDVDGNIVIGVLGPGDMTVTSAAAECTDLTVGGGVAGASGLLVLEPSALMYVEDAQVGGTGGFGLVRIDQGATLTVSGTMRVGGLQGGLVTVNGRIDGQGTVAADAGGIINGSGSITANEVENGGSIAPGLSPGTLTIEGNYRQLAGGRVEIEYGGVGEGEFDQLVVTGEAALGGRLEVQFTRGFSPADPDEFVHAQDFINAAQGIVGDYDERLFVYPEFFADFDDDGDKDLRDLAAFADCFAESGGPTVECERADWEHDGVIGGREIQELGTRLTGPR